jgi:hypothetical protein
MGKGAINPCKQSCSRACGLSPPCLQRAQRGKGSVPLGLLMASCSPFGSKGRLVPTTWVCLSTAATVEAPARMPVHISASTPSCGGRERINGTSVSRCPEANCRIASFVYYSYCRNRKKYTKTINRASRKIFIALSSRRMTRWQRRLPPAEC